MRGWVAWVWMAASAAGWGQTPVVVRAITPAEIGQAETTVYATPPTLRLIPHGPDGRTGEVWVRSSVDGLHVWGRVVADKDSFVTARQKADVLASDHVEVWLAAEPEVPMPKIGWGNQFGPNELAGAKDCEAGSTDGNGVGFSEKEWCARWFNAQVVYRGELKRLFVRQWLVATVGFEQRVFEDYATTAYAGLKSSLFKQEMPKLLEPKEDDGVTAEWNPMQRQETAHDAAGNAYQRGHMTGYMFHVVIPYGAFPPAREMAMRDVSLMVDVFRGAPAGKKMGEFSSTSAARVWGRPATFNRLRLATPRVSAMTPCQEPLGQKDLYGASFAGWYLPGKDTVLTSSFALINPEQGYLYEAGGRSPEVVEKVAFVRPAADGATVCGPELAWAKAGRVVRSKFVVDGARFETKVLPDGWTLVMSGPRTWTHSPFGSGQCGACEVMGMEVYAVSPAGEITSALELEEDMSGEAEDHIVGTDVAIEPDWERITLYRESEDYAKPDARAGWEAKRFCLEGHTYKACGVVKGAKPPEPARFKELRQDE